MKNSKAEKMLNINKEENRTNLTVSLEGRLDTTTAPQFEGELTSSLDGKTEVILDLAKIPLSSPAGNPWRLLFPSMVGS